jgi:hypothetical protein
MVNDVRINSSSLPIYNSQFTTFHSPFFPQPLTSNLQPLISNLSAFELPVPQKVRCLPLHFRMIHDEGMHRR